MSDLLGTLRDDPDGTASARFTRHYDTDAGDLWHAVTTPERLSRWFAPVTGELEVGGTFTVHFSDADASGCRVTACDPPTSFSYVWPHATGESTVSVEVVPDGAGSLLRVVHSRLLTDKAPLYAAGWDAYLLALTACLDDGPPRDWGSDFEAASAGYLRSAGR